MELRVLGCAGAEFPGFHPPGFLVDDRLLFDAGTLGAVLTEEEQWAISHIFVTHAHLDHVRGIPVLADNIIIKMLQHNVQVVGPASVIDALRKHVLNDIIWPDFARLPSADAPVISYREVEPGTTAMIDGYAVTPVTVNHSVPAVGYIVRKGEAAFFYTGDTGPTEAIARHGEGLPLLIVEVSFPNAMEEMAIMTGHMTPHLLEKELGKIDRVPGRILVTHPKPQYYDLIRAELAAVGLPQIELLQDGNRYTL
jgi:ribonuclease BN (tRNA processing enzyme)